MSLVLLCGALLSTMEGTIAAAGKEVFAVNFADLGALVMTAGSVCICPQWR